MGVFDKIKNALFEEEYYEVEEKPKKKPKVKEEKIKEKKPEKPIAKKIVLPTKKEKVEEIEEEDLKDENFEFRPKDEIILDDSDKVERPFKMVDDEDLLIDEELTIEPVHDDKKYEFYDFNKEESFDKPIYEEQPKINESYNGYKGTYKDEVSSFRKEREAERGPYGMNEVKTERMPYESKEERKVFRATPVISPIYGILDKNYKKEDIVPKKEVRLSSTFTRGRVSIDDIRRKAYGTLSDDLADNFMDNDDDDNKSRFDIDESVSKEEDLLVDLSEEKKPAVKEVTMGDALEYFEDLGLEYNVDYMDEKREVSKNDKEKLDLIKEEPKKETRVSKIEEEKEEIVEDKKEKTEQIKDDDSDDNLFDLIDSMYQE